MIRNGGPRQVSTLLMVLGRADCDCDTSSFRDRFDPHDFDIPQPGASTPDFRAENSFLNWLD